MTPSANPARDAYYERMMSAEHDARGGARAPSLRYCIASTPRSGSTLLSRTLEATGLAGVPMEYLNPAFIGGWVRLHRGQPVKLAQYLADIESRRTTANGVFGLKLHWAQVRYLAASGKQPVTDVARLAVGAHDRFILINRRDKLSQAISLHIANHTKVYHSDQLALRETKTEPAFDAASISAHIARLFAEEADWRAYLRARGAPCIEVFYEDLVADHGGTCRRVLDFLGLDQVDVPPPPTTKLQTIETATFRRLYLETLGS
ncbi:MAG: Stf0 family sulfotransferase [Opitutales bacterium]